LVAPDTGETLAVLEASGSDHVNRMAFSPDGTKLAVCGVAQREVVVWDLRGVRRELAAIGLDWDRPPYPPDTKARPLSPLQLRIIELSSP
jgi:hypothetical protein